MNSNFFYAIIVFAVVGFSGLSSCKDDDDDNGGTCSAWATSLQDESAAMSTAAQTYATNPTTSNCNAYKNAVQNYIDEAETFRGCSALTGQDRADWEAALDAAQTNLNAFTC